MGMQGIEDSAHLGKIQPKLHKLKTALNISKPIKSDIQERSDFKIKG